MQTFFKYFNFIIKISLLEARKHLMREALGSLSGSQCTRELRMCPDPIAARWLLACPAVLERSGLGVLKSHWLLAFPEGLVAVVLTGFPIRVPPLRVQAPGMCVYGTGG